MVWETIYHLEEKLNKSNLTELEGRVEVLETGFAELENDIEDLEDGQILDDERFLAVEEDIERLENAVFSNHSNTVQVMCRFNYPIEHFHSLYLFHRSKC